MPKVEEEVVVEEESKIDEKISSSSLLKELSHTIITFFQKPHIGTALFFILTYR
jgi:hypothetical protein